MKSTKISKKNVLVVLLITILALITLTGCADKKLVVGDKTFSGDEVSAMCFLIASYNQANISDTKTEESVKYSITNEAIKILERYAVLKANLKNGKNGNLQKNWQQLAEDMAKSTISGWSSKDKKARKKEGVTKDTVSIYLGLYGYLQPAYQEIVKKQNPITPADIEKYYNENKTLYQNEKKEIRNKEIENLLQFDDFEEKINTLIKKAKPKVPTKIDLE